MMLVKNAGSFQFDLKSSDNMEKGDTLLLVDNVPCCNLFSGQLYEALHVDDGDDEQAQVKVKGINTLTDQIYWLNKSHFQVMTNDDLKEYYDK